MADTILISFVIPSFNDDRIIETIQSIHDSGVPERSREIIIYDGGSSPRLLTEIESALCDNDKLFVEDDDGIFDAINKGLKTARGDYILTLGSDDRVFDLSFDTIKNAKADNIDVLMFDIAYTDKNWQPLRIWKGRQLNLFHYYLGRQYAHFGLVCTPKVYRDAGYFNTANKVNADYEFFYQLCKMSPTFRQRVFSETIVQMRIGGNSSANMQAVLKANLKILDFIFRTDILLVPGFFLKPIYKVSEYIKAKV